MKNLHRQVTYALLLTATTLACAAPAQAYNGDVQSAVQSLGDVSMFYQGIINTGVVNELREDQHYTIFAPTNASFDAISPAQYPCFYSAQCRPQIAEVLRDHIIVGRHDLKDLAMHGSGMQTAGLHSVHVEQPFVGDYTVDGQKILSEYESNGNIIYRIDGVLASRQDLASFQTVNLDDMEPNLVRVRDTYITRQTMPEQNPPPHAHPLPENTTQTTTVIEHAVVTP